MKTEEGRQGEVLLMGHQEGGLRMGHQGEVLRAGRQGEEGRQAVLRPVVLQ